MCTPSFLLLVTADMEAVWALQHDFCMAASMGLMSTTGTPMRQVQNFVSQEGLDKWKLARASRSRLMGLLHNNGSDTAACRGRMGRMITKAHVQCAGMLESAHHIPPAACCSALLYIDLWNSGMHLMHGPHQQ